MANIVENVNQAISDFDSIKEAIEDKGVEVGNAPTSQYGEKIGRIETSGGDPYAVINAYMTDTLVRLRLNNVPSGKLKLIVPGSNVVNSALQNIESIELPNNTDGLASWQFAKLGSLKRFDVGGATNFANVCLSGCPKLEELILRKSDSCATLHSSNSVSFSSNGKIYVPPSLIEDYKVATNWTSYAQRFRKLYYANSDSERDSLLADSTIDVGSMIICDYNESYVVKE